MGVIYRVKCERCGAEFAHQAGVGFVYACVGCGQVEVNESVPFHCPVCNLRHDPREEGFAERLLEVIQWD